MRNATSQPPAASIKVSILMCAYNEQASITQAINEVLDTSYPVDVELIVVDDGSGDETAVLAEKVSDPRLIVLRHEHNQGKGAALRTAASLATGSHILPFDADLEYSAEDIPRLIQPLLKRGYDVVYGTRLFGFNTVYQTYRYAMGNRFLTRIANVLYDASLSDLHTCLKLVPLDLFNALALREPGFGLDTELTASLLRLGIRPFEVPISYYSRSRSQGKKINWRDAVECLAILAKVRLRRKKRLFALDPEEQAADSEPDTHAPSAVRPVPMASLNGANGDKVIDRARNQWHALLVTDPQAKGDDVATVG